MKRIGGILLDLTKYGCLDAGAAEKKIVKLIISCIPFDNPPLCNEAVLDEIERNLRKITDVEIKPKRIWD